MSIEEKGNLIGHILTELKCSGRDYDEGDTFLSLCFKSDAELATIAKRLGIKTA